MVTNSWPVSGGQLLPLVRPFPCLRPALLFEAPTELPGSLQQPLPSSCARPAYHISFGDPLPSLPADLHGVCVAGSLSVWLGQRATPGHSEGKALGLLGLVPLWGSWQCWKFPDPVFLRPKVSVKVKVVLSWDPACRWVPGVWSWVRARALSTHWLPPHPTWEGHAFQSIPLPCPGGEMDRPAARPHSAL